MQIQEKNRQEVETKAKSMSDFLKMEYFEECLRQSFSFDIKKYCNLELGNLYEKRKMFTEAARNMEAAAEISVTFREKKESYMKAVELYIKTQAYERADSVFMKALDCGNDIEKKEMKRAVKILLRQQAEVYEKENRKGHALRVYEKLFKIVDIDEKMAIKDKLLILYNQLGKIREYNMLKGKS